jgi:hypothetical protein
MLKILLFSLLSVLTMIMKLQVFSSFGTVQKIAIFEKNGGTQALIQYPGMRLEIDHSRL